MYLTTLPDALALGLDHVRAWRLTSHQPLLDNAGLTADEALVAASSRTEGPSGYRTLLESLGYAGTVPAGDRLRDTVNTRGWRSHAAVVDAVSIATLLHGGGLGLHRLTGDDERRDLVVTRAHGTERITPAFSTRSRQIPAGDLVYGVRLSDSELQPFAWLGRRDCDSAERQLTEDTCEAVLVALGCPDEDESHTDVIGETVARILSNCRPDISMTALRAREESSAQATTDPATASAGR
ncbi:hypothetical protein [Actinacidiphila glaucinigra]|uniref:hypothetical protein n=1 Tax=Actinacidiphila glaucinigra TaxID=235986 RepID=UPI003D8C7C17